MNGIKIMAFLQGYTQKEASLDELADMVKSMSSEEPSKERQASARMGDFLERTSDIHVPLGATLGAGLGGAAGMANEYLTSDADPEESTTDTIKRYLKSALVPGAVGGAVGAVGAPTVLTAVSNHNRHNIKDLTAPDLTEEINSK
jgi:hypothetical protein